MPTFRIQDAQFFIDVNNNLLFHKDNGHTFIEECSNGDSSECVSVSYCGDSDTEYNANNLDCGNDTYITTVVSCSSGSEYSWRTAFPRVKGN